MKGKRSRGRREGEEKGGRDKVDGKDGEKGNR